MSTTIKTQNLQSRMLALGAKPQDAADLSRMIVKWMESGEEWTVKRLKNLKTEYITTFLATDSEKVVTPWVARSKDGIPKGPLKRLWVDSYYLKRPQVVLDILMVYSICVASQPTETQKEKFLTSARASRVRNDGSNLDCSPLFGEQSPWPSFSPSIDPCPYWTLPRVTGKRSPAVKGTRPSTDVASEMRFASESSAVLELYECWPHLMEWSVPLRTLLQWRRSYTRHDYIGTISFIQEPGYKLRAVANPSRVVQCGLEPLKNIVQEFLDQIPEDCTRDQEKGVIQCQKWLKAGYKLFSVDLSDATNLFPLTGQMAALKGLHRMSKTDKYAWGNKDLFADYIELFRLAAESPWRLPDGERLVFSKGQPLGLGPSFFVFALAHHALLYSLAGRGKYVILGDDIVIRDERLYAAYRLNLSDLGCNVSKDKTITSQQLAEFASRLITRDSVYRQTKWKRLTRANVIDVCRTHGEKFRSVVPNGMLRVIDALAPLPEQVGGLGWNPKGESLDVRLSSPLFERLLNQLKERPQILRRSYLCAVADFHKSAADSFLHEEEQAQDEWVAVSGSVSDNLWGVETRYNPYYDRETDALNSFTESVYSTRVNFGNLIMAPKGVTIDGYIPWSYPPSPWRTNDPGFYQVVSRLLKGETTKGL